MAAPIANTNGYFPIVFTYSGTLFKSYKDFANAFSLEAGPATYFGASNYYGYNNSNKANDALVAYQGFSLGDAMAPVAKAMNTNTTPYTEGLTKALTSWAQNDPSTLVNGISNPLRATASLKSANLALNYLAKGSRIYVYYGSGNLPGLSEGQQPNFWSTPEWVEFFEPYIASNDTGDGHYAPSNGIDLTSIEQFAFPLALNIWGLDNSSSSLTLIDSNGNLIPNTGGFKQPSIDGGIASGSATLWEALQGTTVGSKSNQPSANNLLVSATQAGSSTQYYQDPATNDFPYHYFDNYLLYLSQLTSSDTNGFASAGVADPLTNTYKDNSYTISVDFSGITSSDYSFGAATNESLYIDPTGFIKITGTSTDADNPTFSIKVPWAEGSLGYQLNQDPGDGTNHDAVSRGWIQQPTDLPAGVLADIYVGNLTANQTATQGGQVNIETQYSYSSLTQGQVLWSATGGQRIVTPSVRSGFTDNLVMGVGAYNVYADSDGNLTQITLASPIPVNGTYGIGKTQDQTDTNANLLLTVTMNEAPSLDYVVIENSNASQYTQLPTQLKGPLLGSSKDHISVNYTLNDSAFADIWIPDTSWTTLSQPAGIYGANAGYIINETTEVKALGNDMFGKIVGDVLAGLNTGFFGSTQAWTTPDGTETTVGEAIGLNNESGNSWWFNLGDVNTSNPYVAGAWGPSAWESPSDQEFWNAWAYELFKNTPGQYNFAFTDRFVKGIFTGELNPPDATNPPAKTQPLFAELVIGDSPGLTYHVNQQSFGRSLYRYRDTVTGQESYRYNKLPTRKETRYELLQEFKGFTKQIDEIDATAPLWLLKNKGQCFLTTDPEELNSLKEQGYKKTSKKMYTMTPDSPLSPSGVFHFTASEGGNPNIWTSDPAEIARLGLPGSGYTNHDAAFYV